MFREAIVCIDTETTGLIAHKDRVIEIGLVRVEGGVEVSRFHTLLNPEVMLPSIITDITGITDADLDGAPKFRDIAGELAEFLQGALFVAHNAEFDLKFIREEFARIDEAFMPARLCTVKLSRMLFPYEKRHNLASIIERYNFQTDARHRAFEDALVVWNFLEHVRNTVPEEKLNLAIQELIER